MEHLGTAKIAKLILVVDDVEKKARALAELFGTAAAEIVTAQAPLPAGGSPSVYTKFRDEYIPAAVKLANIQLDGMLIEVIQPLDRKSPWGEFLERSGEGIFSVVFTVPDFDETAEMLSARGAPLFHRGEYPGGRYGYADTLQQIGTTLGLQSFD